LVAFEPLSPPTIANCYGNGPLGIVLANDMPIKLGDNLSRR